MTMRRAAFVAASVIVAGLFPLGGAVHLRSEGGGDAAAKVERLLLDIDESVKKSGSDAEFVYATLYSYDNQLEGSLSNEMEKVSKDLEKLKGLQTSYQESSDHPPSNQHGSSAHRAAPGVGLAEKSRVVRTESATNAEFHSALASVQQLVGRAQSSMAQHNSSSPANPDELAFSTTFTEAVLRIDREFAGKVRESMKRKAELVEEIRNKRQSQHKTLAALLDLLRGRYKVDGTKAEDGSAAGDEGSSSFLQVRAVSRSRDAEQPQQVAQHQQKVSALQYQIEAALKKKEDTHAILLRIKETLDKSAPINADSVQGLMRELGGVLRSVNAEQSRADLAKRRCESQRKHEVLEEQGLRTNMALMDVVHNHTHAAIQAAKSNLKAIISKTKDLQLSTEEFSKIVSKTTATLEDQSQDRRTIMVAVEKAREIVAHMDSSGPASSALLEQMLKELQAQEVGERSYRASEVAFRSSFLAYARSYLQLLKESRGHYESSLSALELYAEEVQSDAVAQADSLATGKELHIESAELCQFVLHFYSHHKKRRQELSQTLRAVLPDVPTVLGGALSPSASQP